MSKLTAFAIGLLTVISIAPNSQAMTANASPVSLKQPAADLHAQLIIKIGGQSDRYSYREDDRRREIEREREAERRRREYYSQRYHSRDRYHRDRDEYRGDYRREYRGEYRRDR